ncbi:MAG TPA: hypothetical protein DEF42_16900 [Desulfosporosinus sp.]|nr:hypothetical protein [Desulfosporosinus sp.]
MKYTRATNYALHSILFLSRNSSRRNIGVQELAENQF